MPALCLARRFLGISALGIALALTTVACSRPGVGTSAAAGHHITLTVEGHGSAALTWSGAEGGAAAHVALPWHLTIPGALASREVRLTVELDAGGGQATCAIAIDGRRLVSSRALGAYGRAVCVTSPPATGRQQADG